MTNGGGARILPILAAVLIVVALSVSVAFVLLRVPDDRRYDDSLLSAQLALAEGSRITLNRELLRASRHALSVSEWTALLSIGYAAIPADPAPRDFRLFTMLAGRASASIPGDQNLLAYWIWGLMRSGRTGQASRALVSLVDRDDPDDPDDPDWSFLRAEVRLKTDLMEAGESDTTLFQSMLERNPDPDFFADTAMKTESAELTYDAALLFMLVGRTAEAFREVESMMDGSRRWRDPVTPVRREASVVAAMIAFDAGQIDQALMWLDRHLETARKNRTVTWQTLQTAGDLHWERYRTSGGTPDLEMAEILWDEAVGLIRSSGAADPVNGTGLPSDAWKLWLNLAVLEGAAGRVVESRETLAEALILFPEQSEVKAAWARSNMERDPALARRLVDTDTNIDPVLTITAIQVDPQAVTPRLYEASLWELFEEVTRQDSSVESVDRRQLTTFLLDYMASRRNMSSIDVAIDRYLKEYPDETWILAWRLAADASRGLGYIDLISLSPDGRSPYEVFRDLALREGGWRAVYDVSLFAYLVSDELMTAASFMGPASIEGTERQVRETALLSLLQQYSRLEQVSGSPLDDRIGNLSSRRDDLQSVLRKLRNTGNRGRQTGIRAGDSLMKLSDELLQRAADDLEAVVENGNGNIPDQEISNVLYLQALALHHLAERNRNGGREALQKAQAALEHDPNNARANELMNDLYQKEVAP